MTRFFFAPVAAMVALALVMLPIACTPAPTGSLAPARRGPQETASSLAGVWVCRDVRSFPEDFGWGDATACTLCIRRLTTGEKETHTRELPTLPPGVSRHPYWDADELYPGETEVDVALWLSKPGKQWPVPDTTPGWIDADGNIWLGPIGSALTFKPSLQKDGRLVLKFEDFTLTFERQVGKR
jgi:hypothetical protein